MKLNFNNKQAKHNKRCSTIVKYIEFKRPHFIRNCNGFQITKLGQSTSEFSSLRNGPFYFVDIKG